MNPKLVLFLLCISLATAHHARAKTILPDACGDDSVKFDVATQKDQLAPASPAAGQAQIVFIESFVRNIGWIGGGPIIRFGMDGAWVGADKGDSYFTLTVNPGVHHLCASLQTISGRMKKNSVELTSFTAEPGKTYYYQFTLSVGAHSTMGASGPGATNGGGASTDFSFDLAAVNDDVGRFRIKASPLATSKPK
jgi:hypothetical protein